MSIAKHEIALVSKLLLALLVQMPIFGYAQTVRLQYFGYYSQGGPLSRANDATVFSAAEINLHQSDHLWVSEIEFNGRMGVQSMVSHIFSAVMPSIKSADMCALVPAWRSYIDDWMSAAYSGGYLGYVGVFLLTDEPYLRWVVGENCDQSKINAALQEVAVHIKLRWSQYWAQDLAKPLVSRTLKSNTAVIAIDEPPRSIGFDGADLGGSPDEPAYLTRGPIASAIDLVGIQCYPNISPAAYTATECLSVVDAFLAAPQYSGKSFFLIPPVYEPINRSPLITEADAVEALQSSLNRAATDGSGRIKGVMMFSYDYVSIYTGSVCTTPAWPGLPENPINCTLLRKFPAIRQMIRAFSINHIPSIAKHRSAEWVGLF